MTNGMDMRRRRALYRAAHRGTKEMDWLIGRFAEARVAGMDATEIARFERLLDTADPELERWILGPADAEPDEFADFVAALRRFHGL